MFSHRLILVIEGFGSLEMHLFFIFYFHHHAEKTTENILQQGCVAASAVLHVFQMFYMLQKLVEVCLYRV